jgi:hypothetical protein
VDGSTATTTTSGDGDDAVNIGESVVVVVGVMRVLRRPPPGVVDPEGSTRQAQHTRYNNPNPIINPTATGT